MDGSRVMRAVVTVITVLICVWALSLLRSNKQPNDNIQEAAKPATQEARNIANEILPPVGITKLPLVAFDNTCEYSNEIDISGCTGVLSGSASRIYELNIESDQNLNITLEPRSDFFDPSFAIISENHTCVAGSDNHGPGLAEKIESLNLLTGNYKLIVSGYNGDCGPARACQLPSFDATSASTFA